MNGLSPGADAGSLMAPVNHMDEILDAIHDHDDSGEDLSAAGVTKATPGEGGGGGTSSMQTSLLNPNEMHSLSLNADDTSESKILLDANEKLMVSQSRSLIRQ